MLNKLKNLFAKKPEPKKVDGEVKKSKAKKVELTEKEKATANGEPYVAIIKVEVNPDDINDGAFEFDWNDKFIINLIKAGYKIKETDTDSDIIERWFQTVARNIAMELYDQRAADPSNRSLIREVSVKKLDNGRTEVS